MKTKLLISSLFYLLIINECLFAQDNFYNPIITAMPSLLFAPDARSGGMGDVGVASMPDIYSQHWNSAKYPFIISESGITFSYTPWLSKIVDDINLLYASGYYKFGQENINSISTSLRYFSIGEVNIMNEGNQFWNIASPHEFAFDIAYSRKLTNNFSGSVALRYIQADYSTGDGETSMGNAFAADIAGYNEAYINFVNSEALLGMGFNISNIGTKISYDGGSTSMFLPTNLRIGTSIGYPINKKNTISLSLDINKLLVPTPQLATENESEDERIEKLEIYSNISSIEGIFKSFGDSPGGFKEEIKEITWSLGSEYVYDNKIILRAGYHHENEFKGNRRYVTFGTGFKTNTFHIDAAYLVSTSVSNPLDQTLRLSIGFDMEGIKNLIR